MGSRAIELYMSSSSINLVFYCSYYGYFSFGSIVIIVVIISATIFVIITIDI